MFCGFLGPPKANTFGCQPACLGRVGGVVGIREKMNIPRGERYELCRSVHAEANAIISAERERMIGSSLYLSGREMKTGEYIKNSCCCSMCKRMVINAGIEEVIVRETETEYTVYTVSDWIENDDSLSGKFGY